MFQCVEASGLSVEKVQKCFTSQEGYQMMLKAEIETKAMTPGPRFVPTIVFDDVRGYFYINQNFTQFIDFLTFCH